MPVCACIAPVPMLAGGTPTCASSSKRRLHLTGWLLMAPTPANTLQGCVARAQSDMAVLLQVLIHFLGRFDALRKQEIAVKALHDLSAHPISAVSFLTFFQPSTRILKNQPCSIQDTRASRNVFPHTDISSSNNCAIMHALHSSDGPIMASPTAINLCAPVTRRKN